MALAAPIEPLKHQTMHRMIKLAQCPAVVGHAKVIEVPGAASPPSPATGLARAAWCAPRAEPVIDVHQRPPQPSLGRLTLELHHPPPTRPPEVSKPQEVERRHPLLCLEYAPGLAFPEGKELSLGLVQP